MAEGIPCFTGIKLKIGDKTLEEIFNEKAKGLSPSEQRKIGTDIALEYHKQLHEELNTFKKSIKAPVTKYEAPKVDEEKIKAINERYQKQIDEANTPIAEPVKPEESKPTETKPDTDSGAAVPPKEPPKKEPVKSEDEESSPQRRFTKQMLKSDELSEASKADIAKTLDYVRQTNEMTLKEAADVINKVGVDEAQNLVMNDGELKPVVRVVVGMTLIKKYNELAAKAESQADKDYYYDKSIQTATFVTEKLGTEPGQMIQAFSLWSRLSPEAQLRAAVKDVKQQYAKKAKKRKPDIDDIGEKLQKANEEAAEELTKSKKVKSSVDKAQKTGVQKAKDKVQKAKDKRKKLIDKYKGKKGGGLTLSSGGLTKEGIEYVGELVKTYIDEGIANLELIARNISQHLKDVGANVSDDVNRNISDIIREQLDASANKKIAKSLSELETEVGKIIRSHYTVPVVQGESLKQKLINEAGLEGKEAEDLANEIQKEFEAIATRKKQDILFKERAKLDKIQHDLERGVPKKRKEVQDDIVKYSNLGAFSQEDFFDFLSKKLNLGTLTAVEAKEIERLAKLIEKAPEGSPKNDATQDLLKFRANMKGVSFMEAAQAVWYANILSGHKTHAVNIVSTFFNGLFSFASEAVRSPRSIPVMMYGAARGLRRGGFEAWHTLTTGRSPIHISKIETPGTLERIRFIGGWFNPGNYLKFVGRLMQAEDVLQFQALKEMRATQLAYKEARRLGEKNPFSKKTWKIVEEKLLNTKERSDEAKSQAEQEGLVPKSVEWKRRVYELMELNRDIKMTEEAYGFAAEGTFNHQPEGTLGALNNGISSMLDMTIGGARPLRFFVPFTRIITNVVNNALNYTPVGFIRAARGQRGFESFDKGIFKGAYKELTPEQRKQIIAKASLGVALTGGLYALTKIPCKDGHNVLEITGGGTGDYGKDAQLKESGWQPYSIRACGGSYISYKYTPLVYNLAFIGFKNDNEKYGKDDDRTFMNKTMGALYQTGQLALDGTWVSSTSDLMGTIASSSPSQLGSNIEKTVTKMVAQTVVPNYYLQGAQQTEEWMNLNQKDARNQFDRIKQHIPVARNSMNDRLNALGEPIKTDIDVFISEKKPHKIWDFLNEKGIFISTINPNSFIIYDADTNEERKGTDDEYYEFSKLRGDKIRKDIERLMDSDDFPVIEDGQVIKKKGIDLNKTQLKEEIRTISARATTEAKKELFEPKQKDYKKDVQKSLRDTYKDIYDLKRN